MMRRDTSTTIAEMTMVPIKAFFSSPVRIKKAVLSAPW